MQRYILKRKKGGRGESGWTDGEKRGGGGTQATARGGPEKRWFGTWPWGSMTGVAATRLLAEDFYADEGIRVEVQPVPWGNFMAKYLTAMAAGIPPDAGTAHLSAPVDFGKVGGLIDLQESYPAIVAGLKTKIFPRMWESSSFQGHLFGIPHNATALMCFYRKDVFAALGLKAPATWSELEQTIEVLTANGYDYGFLWTRNTHWGLGTFIWPNRELAYSEDGRKVNWLAPGFLKGYRFAVHLWNSFPMVTEKAVELFGLEDPSQSLPLFIDYDMRYSE